MSGHHGQHGQGGKYSQQPYHYGPPQPEWQAPQPLSSRSSWQDPRLNFQSPNAGQSIPSSNYNPHTYAALSGTTSGHQAYYPNPPSQNPATWGVRYNQGYHHDANIVETKPPLPPRPPSATQSLQSPQTHGYASQSPWPAQSSQAGWDSAHTQTNPTNFSTWSYDTQHSQHSAPPQQPVHSHHQQQPSSTVTPPLPPPRPPAYQNLTQGIQGWPDQQYSEQPPSHRYDPATSNQNANSALSAAGRTPASYNQTIVNSDDTHAEHSQQAEQLAVSPISPDTDNKGQFGWEYFDGQPKMQSPLDNEQRPSPVLADAPGSKKPPPRIASPQSNSFQQPTNSTKNNNLTYPPGRDDSVSPELRKTNTIDDLITSWQQPLPSMQIGGLHPRSSRHSSVSALDEAPSPPVVEQVGRSSSIIKSIHQPSLASLDPILQDIQELRPESRASLERYLTALRREGAATTDGEKFRAFKAFMDKEIRLKAILYGIDEYESTAIQRNVAGDASHPQTAKIQESLMPQPSLTQTTGSNNDHDNSGTQKGLTNKLSQARLDRLAISQQETQSPPTSNDDSYVLVDGTGEGEYSPGGRPRLPRPLTKAEVKLPSNIPTISIPTSPEVPPKVQGSPSDYAPMVVEDFQTRGADSPSLNAPIVLEHSEIVLGSTTGSNFKSSYGSVYTPFKYNEGPSNTSYAELRQAVAESGRMLSQANSTSSKQTNNEQTRSSSVTLQQQEETFLGLIREKSTKRKADWEKDVPAVSSSDQNTLASIFEHLQKESQYELKGGSTINSIRQDLELNPDEFGFIRQTVLAWDQENRERTRKLEAGRRQREEESEAHIDELFNAKQIGYPDIKSLESDFERSESQKQQGECREELDSFTSQVYDRVIARLDPEIHRLETIYTRILELLEAHAISHSQLYTSHKEGEPKIAPLLELALNAFGKLQVRYRKRVEADREQRRRSTLCDAASNRILGDVDAASRSEIDYASFEKQSAVQVAKEHDERANKLMDIFDPVVVRALSENEQFIDDLKEKVQHADTETREIGKFKGDLYGPNGFRQMLTLTETIISATSADSASILQSSDVADQLLNNADYDLSVTKARIENADETTYRQLQEDKAREDEKIRAETTSRLNGIKKGPDETLHLVRSIMARIGDDPEHQERIKKALEAAKKRNAAREG